MPRLSGVPEPSRTFSTDEFTRLRDLFVHLGEAGGFSENEALIGARAAGVDLRDGELLAVLQDLVALRYLEIDPSRDIYTLAGA